MHQTISGETHKVKISDNTKLKNYLSNLKESCEKNNFNFLYEYNNNTRLISSKFINGINVEITCPEQKIIHNMIVKEYDEIEKMYSYAGSIFLNNLLGYRHRKTKSFKYHRCDEKVLLSQFQNNCVKNIAKTFIDNFSIERSICVNFYDGKDVHFVSKNDMSFNLEFDHSFLGDRLSYDVKNYKFIIIDGQIESYSEIHHLMFQAQKSKQPYVIFCLGFSQEVLHNILSSNSKGLTEVIPIAIPFNESTANILNDIAILHDADVVSHLKGQTISQEMRKNLPVARNIYIEKGVIKIKPICSDDKIHTHRQFLIRKMNELNPTLDKSFLQNRIKNLSVKSLDLYIPEKMKSDQIFLKDLNYFFSIMSNLGHNLVKITFDKKNIFMPENIYKSIIGKIESCKETIGNINKFIIMVE